MSAGARPEAPPPGTAVCLRSTRRTPRTHWRVVRYTGVSARWGDLAVIEEDIPGSLGGGAGICVYTDGLQRAPPP